jgi:hypothetical protein
MTSRARANPLPVLAGGVTYQVSGWLMGGRIFESINAEAMLFAFLLICVAVFGWIFFTTSAYDASHSFLHRKVGLGLIGVGAVLGVLIRIGI